MAKSQAICSIEGCDKLVKYSGLCSMHAERKRKHGNPLLGSAKIRGACTVVGCESQHFGKGYCRAHWKRFKRYGDPLSGGTGWGEVTRWIHDVALQYEGADCLVFPYHRNPDGYGYARLKGRRMGVHAYITEMVFGAKPTPKHEACHSCGNGHLGCVNPKHLRWGTRSENIRDAVAHGRWDRQHHTGENAAATKFSDKTISEVRSLLASGMTQMNVSALTGISQAHISRIKLGQTR